MPVISKGLEGIVANSTHLSDVLGDKGQLIYAGYDINELAGKVTFEEIIHLLWHGHLPNRKELTFLEQNLRSRRDLPQGVVDFIKGAPRMKSMTPWGSSRRERRACWRSASSLRLGKWPCQRR